MRSVEAAARWASDGITVNAAMPGVVHTNLMRHVDPEVMAQFQTSDAANLA
jgi:NAD(P)-dependent dehydrogenase (short-subunit alcohol dehydrogenase family)